MADGLSRSKKTKREHKNMLIQWGFPIALLFAVLVILVSNFSVISKNDAEETVNKRLMSESAVYAASIQNLLNNTAQAGKTAALLIAGENIARDSKKQDYVARIEESMDSVYMVAYVDMMGVGVTNGDNSVNLSAASYFQKPIDTIHFYVNDDEITGKDAFITVVPVQKNDEQIGMLYIYTNTKCIQDIIPNTQYDGSPAFAIMDSSANILISYGESRHFTLEKNFLDNISNAQLGDFTQSKVKARIVKQIKCVFKAQEDEDTKTLVIVPIGVNGWQYVTELHQKYVNQIYQNEWEGDRNMVIQLAVAVLAFIGLLIVMSLISNLKSNEKNKDLADKADTDLLTELNNKMATERKIQEYMDENPNTQCLMFLFDVDNFKKINDTMGHAFGDEVLKSLGLQLKNEFRVTDILGRTGGDEFIIFLKSIKSDDQLEREGNRLYGFFHQFKAGEYVKYSATASIGAAVFPRDGSDFQSLYRAADHALYEAKRRGKNQLVFYNKGLEKDSKSEENK